MMNGSATVSSPHPSLNKAATNVLRRRLRSTTDTHLRSNTVLPHDVTPGSETMFHRGEANRSVGVIGYAISAQQITA
jgi:hypothetical protein